MAECPEWSHDIPADRESEFLDRVRATYRQISAAAATHVLDMDEPRQWHGTLFRDFVPRSYYAGNYRQDDSERFCLAVNVACGGVAGSPYQIVVPHLAVLFEDLRISIAQLELRWGSFDQPTRARKFATLLATLIGGFIRIHPFINGNGRVSRLLWAWGLLRFGLPIQCRVHPRPTEPYSQIMAACMTGNDGPLAFHILQAMAQELPIRR